MKIITAMLLIGAMALCGCAHVASTKSVFFPRADTAPLVLQITRHVDTVVNGPDLEEDQRLILDIKEFQLGKKILIPSPLVGTRFAATRFGPTTKGQDFHGYVLVKSVSPDQVVAVLDLELVARTVSGGYSQKVKYSDTYTFRRAIPNDSDAP